MKDISLIELYELYIDTLRRCGSFMLNESDEFINYNLFEEFDIGVISFLHEENLKKLFEGGLININQMEESSNLRKMVIELQKDNLWNIQEFRTSEKWKKVIQICDKLNAEI